MALTAFLEEYTRLSPNEQAQFAEAIRRLLADGLIWREEENERRIYHFIARRASSIRDYLSVAGWELRHDERLGILRQSFPRTSGAPLGWSASGNPQRAVRRQYQTCVRAVRRNPQS